MLAKETSHRAPLHESNATLRGIYLLLASEIFFAGYNAIGKWLATGYSPVQIIFFRGLFGLLPVAILVWQAGGRPALRSHSPGWQILRAVCSLTSNIAFILAYRTMPLADAMAIGYASPIVVTALSVPLLSERVGLHRWSAVVVGFAGILIIARPGTGVFGAGGLLAMAGTLFYALSILATRRLAGRDQTVCTMVYSTGLYVLLCGLPLPFLWVTPSWPDLALLAALGMVGGLGMFLFISAFRFAPASTLAPFDYTAIGWAALFGFAVWGEIPGLYTVTGILIIAASGLYIVHRERIRSAC